MTRYVIWTAVVLAAVLVGWLIGLAFTPIEDGQSNAAAPGPTIPTPLSRYAVVGSILRDTTTGQDELAYLPGYAPTSPTPTNATATPLPPASATPGPIVQPTLTPTPTATVTATPTPTPTSEPPPTPEVFVTCQVEILPAVSPGLNVRVWPEVPSDGTDNFARDSSGQRIRFAPGRVVEVVAIFEQQRTATLVDVWALAVEGWFAMTYQGYVFARETASTPHPCSAVQHKHFDRALDGYHTVSITVQAAPVAAHYAHLGSRAAIYKEALFPGGSGAARAVLAANPAVRGIARRGAPDCPMHWGEGDPIAKAEGWYAGLKPFFAANADWATWYEYLNECGHLVSWRWQIDFMWAFVKLAHADGYCTLSGSWYPTAPDPWQWAHPYLHDFMQWLLEHPCANGESHGWAMHLYHTANTDWWHYGRIKLLAMNMPPLYQLLPVHVTELGVIDMAKASDPVDFGELARLNRAQIEGYRRMFWVDGFAVWNLGCCVGWIDLTPVLGNPLHLRSTLTLK